MQLEAPSNKEDQDFLMDLKILGCCHSSPSRDAVLYEGFSQRRLKGLVIMVWILGLFIRKFPHIFRPLSPILSIFFVKIPHIVQHLLMEMNGSTPISSNPSK